MVNNKLSRRQALKTLLAAGGSIGAASFLPARWMKPVVQSGVLPAHAQASGMASCAPLFDLEFLNAGESGEYYLEFQFVSDPDPRPTSYTVSNVSIKGTTTGWAVNDGIMNGITCSEINEINPGFWGGYIGDYESGAPTYVTATITFNFGEGNNECMPAYVTSNCAFTYRNREVKSG